jgi:hypothetical protein
MVGVNGLYGSKYVYTHRSPLPPGNIPGTHFCLRLSQPQGHSAVGRIMSMKNSNDTIGNRSRELPGCSAVPQPLRHRVPLISYHIISYHIISYHIISYHIISYHIISYHIISYYIISYHIISYHIISYHIISYHIISYHIISYYIISYHIISYHII